MSDFSECVIVIVIVIRISLRRRFFFSKTRRSRTTSNLTPPESQSARDSCLQEEGGVADFAEADLDAVEVKRDIWCMSGEFVYRHHVVLREIFYVPKESSFPTPLKYIDVARQPKKQIGQFGRQQYR